MVLTESDIISRYFQQPGLAADPAGNPAFVLGIGDDCALLQVPPGQHMAMSMDVLVEGVHFPFAADPTLIAQRALAVNLSDLAAMGAAPLCFMLGLTLPEATEQWLEPFVRGLRLSVDRYRCPLAGGNLTRGPLQISIQVHGLLPAGTALLRSGAKPGDDVYISGTPGLAALALDMLQGRLNSVITADDRQLLRKAYWQPEPRLALGQALRGIAHAAQDVSDGVLADLQHVARASGVRIELDEAALPLAPQLTILAPERATRLLLGGGDDYELVFTAPVAARSKVAAAAATTGTPVSQIGRVLAGVGVEVRGRDGKLLVLPAPGYDHFATGNKETLV